LPSKDTIVELPAEAEPPTTLCANNFAMTEPAEPFLRWAGGKRWLARRVNTLFPNLSFERYHEPFLGSGAMFFQIASGQQAFLSDQNPDLVSAYEQLKKTPTEIIELLKTYKNTEVFYYKVRAKVASCPIEAAAHFLYLNQTSFNGIYRVNLKGQYNVPFGHRSKNFVQEDVLLAASMALKNTSIVCQDFDDAIAKVRGGDLVFLDPPYTVSHNKNGFIKYNEKLFSLEDQYRLAIAIERVKAIGAYYILTNAAHEKVAEIFSEAGEAKEVSRANLIGGRNAARGAISEFVFTNLECTI
jgi:DNA adenine methylase